MYFAVIEKHNNAANHDQVLRVLFGGVVDVA